MLVGAATVVGRDPDPTWKPDAVAFVGALSSQRLRAEPTARWSGVYAASTPLSVLGPSAASGGV